MKEFTPSWEDDDGSELWRGWNGHLDSLGVDLEVSPLVDDAKGSSRSEQVLLKEEEALVSLPSVYASVDRL